MTVSESGPQAAAQTFPADLHAKALIVIGRDSIGVVDVAAVCENLGPGRATGPFTIALAVWITDGSGNVTEYYQAFEAPSLAGGPPVFEAEIALPPGTGSGSIWQTTYATPFMPVPLRYRDQDGSVYQAEFLVDAGYVVSDPNRANNVYAWPPPGFWFMSPEARSAKEPVVHARSVQAQAR